MSTGNSNKGWVAFGIVLALLITTVIFALIYSNVLKKRNNVQLEKWQDEAKRITDSLHSIWNGREQAYKLERDRLQDSLNKKKEEYGNIEKSYDLYYDYVSNLGADEQVLFLADWLSKKDSVRWRYSGSVNTTSGQKD